MSQQFSSDDLFQLLQNLLPPGIAFPRDPSSTQSKLLKALADAESPTVGRSANLLIDSFPPSSAELLPEWEETLGLPDPCIGPAPTLEQRQKAVTTRLTATGGQSIPYFIKYAESLGYPGTTFTEFAAYRVGMRIGLPMAGEGWEYALQINGVNQLVHYFLCGHDTTGTPFAFWDNNALLCELKKVLPAHLYILFNTTSDTTTPFATIAAIVESSHIAEAVVGFISSHRAAILEQAAITDLPNALTASGHSGAIAETGAILDALTGLGQYKRFQQEAGIITSRQDGQRNVLHETAAIADVVAVTVATHIAAIAQTGAITDAPAAKRQLLAAVAQSGALADAVRVATANYIAAIAETSTIVDSANAQAHGDAAMAETGALAEAVRVATAHYIAAITETGAIASAQDGQSNTNHETGAITSTQSAKQGYKSARAETGAISDTTDHVVFYLVDPVTGNFVTDPVTGNRIIDPTR